ncbi:hypothetical protein Tco_0602028 [Tanacetum coccineum]
MAFSFILISSDSSEENVGTSTAQILPALPSLPRRLAILVSLGQPIPVGRSYCTQPNGKLQMLTFRKRVRPLPTHRLALRYSADYSSSDQFTSDNSSRDSLSDSSSETSSDSHSDSSSNSPSRHTSSGYAISNSHCDSPNATFERPSCKRCRSPSVPVSSPMHGALSAICADLSPPPKRIRDSDSVTDFEVSSEDGYEPYVPREYIAYADAIRSKGMDDRDVAETMAIEEVESSVRGIIGVEIDPRVDWLLIYPTNWLFLSRRDNRFLLVGPTVPNSSSETSSDSHSDSSSDSPLRHSSSGYAISDSPCDSPTATSKRPSRKRCRSPSVPVSLPVYVDLSPIRVDLSPPHKRIRDSNLVTDLEVSSEDGYELYVPSEVSLGVDVEDSYEPYTEPNVDSVVQTYINDCIMYADAIRARWVDNRDVAETMAIEESVRDDVPDHVTAEGAVKVTYETLRDLVHRFHNHAVEILIHQIQVIESE